MELKPLRPSNLIRVMPAKEVKELCSCHPASSVWSTPPTTCPSCRARRGRRGRLPGPRQGPRRRGLACLRGVGGRRGPVGSGRPSWSTTASTLRWRRSRRRPPRAEPTCRSRWRAGSLPTSSSVPPAGTAIRLGRPQLTVPTTPGSGRSSPRTSKAGLPAPLGTEAVRVAAGILPLVGIGGIDPVTARVVRAAGAEGVAVIGAIWRHRDPVAAARELVEAAA